MRHVCVVAALAATLITAAPALASWDETRTVFPGTAALYNTCNDELVLVNYDEVQVVRQRMDDGRLRWQMTTRWTNVRAINEASGRVYHVRNETLSSMDSRPDKGIVRQTDASRLTPQAAWWPGPQADPPRRRVQRHEDRHRHRKPDRQAGEHVQDGLV